jgi:hypothetical protein
MRTGLVIDAPLRETGAEGTARRERVIDLILSLAVELHSTGLDINHADPTDRFGWNVNGIETCRYGLCVEALATIEDIKSVAANFPINPNADGPELLEI